MLLTVRENNDATILGSVRTGGSVQDITNWSFFFLVVDANGDTVISKRSSNSGEILISDAPNGKIQVLIKPADTQGKAGAYKYELQGTDPANRQYTLDGVGDFVISPTII